MKKDKNNNGRDVKDVVLKTYIDGCTVWTMTSQDICDNLRDTISLSPDEVTQWMVARGYGLVREDDRLVWVPALE